MEPYPSPVSYKGEYHYCSGSTKQELKGAALERFLLAKRGRHWDDAPVPSFTPRSCSAAAIRLFRERAAERGRMDRAVLRDSREVLLGNLELTERHGLRRAACLLFSDRPGQYVSGAWIKIGYFVTDDDLRYQDEVHGSLFAQVEAALDLVRTKYLKAYIRYEGLLRKEAPLFPEAALREALLNAVVHKDYASGIPIQISVYEDRVVFWNPGVLPDHWTVERLLGKHPSVPYNPLVANAFFRAGYIESWGRGVEKIHRACREAGLELPAYDAGLSGLMLTLRAGADLLHGAGAAVGARTTQETTQETNQETNQEKTQDRIVAMLRVTPTLTGRQLAERLGLSEAGVKHHLAKLRAAGRIRHVGPTKAGRWEVVG